jgi:hypothetical protein
VTAASERAAKEHRLIDRLAVGLLAIGLLILLFFLFPSQLVKNVGDALLIVPDRLGVFHRVTPAEIRRLKLRAEVPTKERMEAGKYLVFTDSVQLLLLGAMKERANALVEWMIVRRADGRPGSSTVTSVSRGLRPYDTPVAAGRPILRFSIKDTGDYEILGRIGGEGTQVSIVPDRTSGKEYSIALLFLIQIIILLSPLCVCYSVRLRRVRAIRQLLRREQRLKADQLVAKPYEKGDGRHG